MIEFDKLSVGDLSTIAYDKGLQSETFVAMYVGNCSFFVACITKNKRTEYLSNFFFAPGADEMTAAVISKI